MHWLNTYIVASKAFIRFCADTQAGSVAPLGGIERQALIVAFVDIDPPDRDRRTAELPRVLCWHLFPDALYLEFVELLLTSCLDQGCRKLLLREVTE